MSCGENKLDKTNRITMQLVYFTSGSAALFFWLLIRHAYFGTCCLRWQTREEKPWSWERQTCPCTAREIWKHPWSSFSQFWQQNNFFVCSLAFPCRRCIGGFSPHSKCLIKLAFQDFFRQQCLLGILQQLEFTSLRWGLFILLPGNKITCKSFHSTYFISLRMKF